MKKYNFLKIGLVLIFFLGLNSCSSDSSDDPIEITVSTSDFTANIDENPATGQVIGTVSGSTNQGSVIFSITEQSPSGAFTIDSNTGELCVANESLYDYEVNPTITGIVKVANGSVFENSIISVNVNDVEEVNIFEGDIELITQEDLNEFGSNNYTEITGNLSINSCFGNNICPIIDFSPLGSVKNVGGSLYIFGYDFNNLDGLNLISVEDNITINYCLSLTNIDSLISITSSISGNVSVYYNPLLGNVDGLSNINSINGTLKISYNDNLLNIDGLNNMQHIGGQLRVKNNALLYNLCGISSLIQNNGLTGDYLVDGNAYNPTQQNIIDGNCSL